MIMLQRFTVFLFVFATFPSFGNEETNVVAVSSWSEPVDSVRGRLLICKGYSPGYAGSVPETQVYLELQNVGTSKDESVQIHFDPRNGLRCELKDEHNQAPPQTGTGGSGSFPAACWVTLPYDSTVRLRASWYGYGMPEKAGLIIPLFNELIIQADNTKDYYLSGTFTASSATNRVSAVGSRIWQGTLALPQMKVSARRP
jgi:hypothetical protein